MSLSDFVIGRLLKNEGAFTLYSFLCYKHFVTNVYTQHDAICVL